MVQGAEIIGINCLSYLMDTRPGNVGQRGIDGNRNRQGCSSRSCGTGGSGSSSGRRSGSGSGSGGGSGGAGCHLLTLFLTLRFTSLSSFSFPGLLIIFSHFAALLSARGQVFLMDLFWIEKKRVVNSGVLSVLLSLLC